MTPTLDDLLAELKRRKVVECTIRDPREKEHVEGLLDGDVIYIDPRGAIVEMVLHEVLHRLDIAG